MKQEESLHSLVRSKKQMLRNCQNLQQRVLNLHKMKQSRLKSLENQIDKIQKNRSLISGRKNRDYKSKGQQQIISYLPGISKTRQSVQLMLATKQNIAKGMKDQWHTQQKQLQSQKQIQMQNKIKKRNYQRLKQLQGRQKIDKYWNTKLDFHRNQKLLASQNILKSIGLHQSRLDTLRLQQSSLLKQIENTSKIQDDILNNSKMKLKLKHHHRQSTQCGQKHTLQTNMSLLSESVNLKYKRLN